MDRVADADSLSMVGTYEKRIRRVETEKIIVTEKIADCGRPVKGFDQIFRTALDFLGSPMNLWGSEKFEIKGMVLKLAFPDGLTYARNEGFRTANLALLLKVLPDFFSGKEEMVRLEGDTSNRLFDTLEEWSAILESNAPRP